MTGLARLTDSGAVKIGDCADSEFASTTDPPDYMRVNLCLSPASGCGAFAAHACEPYGPLLSFAFRYYFAPFSPGWLVRTFGRTIHADHRSLPAPREARTGRHGNRLPRPRHAAPEDRRRQGHLDAD